MKERPKLFDRKCMQMICISLLSSPEHKEEQCDKKQSPKCMNCKAVMLLMTNNVQLTF